MYIAGLNLQLTHNQGVEGIVVASVCATQVIVAGHARSIIKAGKKAGNMKTMPTSLLGRLITPFHASVQMIPPLVYVATVAYNHLQQPAWMEDVAFPMEADLALGVGGKAMIRTLASLALVLWTRYNRVVLDHLGDEWHYIGIREKPKKIVNTGPYAYVRHPLYSGVLFQQLLYIPMFWSYVPCVCLPLVFGALVVKTSIEEKLIDEDPIAGNDYLEYKKQVPYKLIPYVY
ncbi:hypothetical protein PLEOSDRAFT_1113575 [Pleurotus ostreatus PC15]|uniref:Protein-S-isoprenylcysteine O-methyltransferase n=1 Tax=Pleurotus ostreatus (strain PC15) TaxID=1137138 RepID=A0A067NCQ5_PLEO1|nr:hypothetical protein PLEOSDRAFT_1113575 [Pleurotus ostreatus PC15]